jgi:hypothetical protein
LHDSLSYLGALTIQSCLLSPNVKVFYHRSCYKTYTSKHKCRPFMQLEENEDTGSIPDSAVIQTWSVVQPLCTKRSSLILEIRQSKATSWADCSVTLNSTLSGIKCNKNLLNYGSSITIQPQRGQGMSSIVFSSSFTIADAIAAAAKLKFILKITQFEHWFY